MRSFLASRIHRISLARRGFHGMRAEPMNGSTGASPRSFSHVPAAFTARIQQNVAAKPLTVEQIAALPLSKVTGAHIIGIPPPPRVERPTFSPANPLLCAPLDLERRIFCNRSLNMASIKAVGFDMDYTLAQYKPETFEVLAHELTKKNLVRAMGYPDCVLDFTFDWRYMQKGLTIDKVRGNVLKRDRHHYVKVAYHGFTELEKRERHELYAQTLRDSFDNSDNYTMIDTLFSLAEAHLFMQLVELKDHQPHLLGDRQYKEIYQDVRSAVDLCHRDGSLKKAVAKDPAKYIHEDPSLVHILKMFRNSGRKLFLATNSLWDYTNVVMNFLLEGKVGDKKDETWLGYFDVVITGCGKPAFFNTPRPLYEVHTPTGMLFNTDNGSPMMPIDGTPQPQVAVNSVSHGSLDGKARVFQGGYYTDLHKFLGVSRGDEVLYVGDHIFGDILKSKKSLNWRTMLVVPELETELRTLKDNVHLARQLQQLGALRDVIENQVQRYEDCLRECADCAETLAAARDTLEELRDKWRALHDQHTSHLRDYHGRFHSLWGAMMKSGRQSSFFAHQVERFACLYTSHVANLLLVSPNKSYVAAMDTLPHEETVSTPHDASPPSGFEGFHIDA